MANNYRLTIHDVYGKGKDLKLTYNQGQTSSQVIKINYIDCTFTLKNFSYTKAIYQPGEIQITLILTKEKDSFSLSDVKAVHSSLINRNVKLEFSESSSIVFFSSGIVWDFISNCSILFSSLTWP